MLYYYINDSIYQELINGFNFGFNTPPFNNVGDKHYILAQSWEDWVSSKPNNDYVLNVFPDFSSVQDFTDNNFVLLEQSEYKAHKEDLTNNDEDFVKREWELCEYVSLQMSIELNRQVRQAIITPIHALLIQELFGKQSPIAYTSIEDISTGNIVPVSLIYSSSIVEVSIPVYEYLNQMRSLFGAYERLRHTDVNGLIGFTQEIKDIFLELIKKERIALNA